MQSIILSHIKLTTTTSNCYTHLHSKYKTNLVDVALVAGLDKRSLAVGGAGRGGGRGRARGGCAAAGAATGSSAGGSSCSSSRRVGTHPGESGGGLVEGARDGRGEALQDLRAERETARYVGNCFKVEELVMIAEMKSNGFYQLGEISIRARQKLHTGTCT